jgi:hypothetical protein
VANPYSNVIFRKETLISALIEENLERRAAARISTGLGKATRGDGHGRHQPDLTPA